MPLTHHTMKSGPSAGQRIPQTPHGFARTARRRILAWTALLLLPTLLGCPDDPVPSQPITISSITVQPSSLNLRVQESQALTVTARTSKGEIVNGKGMSFVSSNAGIATVSADGMVTGIATGSASITIASVDVPTARTTVPVTVSASAAVLHQLSIVGTGAGGGSGRVISTPLGIDCLIASGVAAASGCSATFGLGTTVVLSTQSGTATFTQDCTGNTSCSVVMTAARTVRAAFSAQASLELSAVAVGLTVAQGTPPQFATVNVRNAGVGTLGGLEVTPSAPWLSATLSSTTVPADITIRADPTGLPIGVYSGQFIVKSSDVNVANSPQTLVVLLTITEAPKLLSVTTSGTGTGVVSSTPSGINCPTVCSANYVSGTSVTLTATPTNGSVFSGWSGACSGATSTCTVSMSVARSVTASFTASVVTHVLTTTIGGSGTGTVSSSPAGIACPGTCAASYETGTSVTLTAAPANGSTFTGWEGNCSGSAAVCTVEVTSARTVTATFATVAPTTYALTVTTSGNGSVTSAPSGINCPGSCSANYASGTVVVLTATPANGAALSSWTGDCAGSATTCSVTMSAARTVQAVFSSSVANQLLTITTSGSGVGAVTSTPAGINCPSVCTQSFPTGASVSLNAVASSGSTFSGWTGYCSGTLPSCIVLLNAPQSTAATFVLNAPVGNFALTVSASGTGTGTITSAPAGVNCPTTCTANFSNGTSVTLTAAPTGGSTFTGWTGACTGTSTTCTVSMTAARTATATFAAPVTPTFALTVTTAGTGTGSVTSNAGGIVCPTTCSASYVSGTSVVLTATPTAGGHTFGGWTGACSGTGTCTVSMTAARAVTATFNAPVVTNFVLTVTKSGTGTGTVASTPAGINCGATCSAPYASGTAVTLSATPTTGQVFTGWSGACTGTGTCAVTMSIDRAVTAGFATVVVPPAESRVAITGAGSGNVVVNPASAGGTAICQLLGGTPSGAGCSQLYTFAVGSAPTITLTATAAAQYAFTSWSGACTGTTSACQLSLQAAQNNVFANFRLLPQLSVSIASPGGGKITSTPAGLDCGPGTGAVGSCSLSYPSGTTVTLTATPSAGYLFDVWSVLSSGTTTTCTNLPTCTVLVQWSPSGQFDNASIAARFRAAFQLSVAATGTGTGTVTSNIAGISCPGDCSEQYLVATTVILTASPASGTTFAGWSGACTGTQFTCTVTVNDVKQVSATFNLTPVSAMTTWNTIRGACAGCHSTQIPNATNHLVNYSTAAMLQTSCNAYRSRLMYPSVLASGNNPVPAGRVPMPNSFTSSTVIYDALKAYELGGCAP